MTGDGSFAELPAVLLGRADALLLQRLVEAGPVRVCLALAHRTGPPVEESNVIAEIPGTSSLHEVVVLHAHLDSVYSAPGALDDAAGVAMVMEAARLLWSANITPRRSIRFILFTGEEQGMLGARAYATSHRHELDAIAAALAVDGGAGRITGFDPLGRPELAAGIRAALRPPLYPASSCPQRMARSRLTRIMSTSFWLACRA